MTPLPYRYTITQQTPSGSYLALTMDSGGNLTLPVITGAPTDGQLWTITTIDMASASGVSITQAYGGGVRGLGVGNVQSGSLVTAQFVIAETNLWKIGKGLTLVADGNRCIQTFNDNGAVGLSVNTWTGAPAQIWTLRAYQ